MTLTLRPPAIVLSSSETINQHFNDIYEKTRSVSKIWSDVLKCSAGANPTNTKTSSQRKNRSDPQENVTLDGTLEPTMLSVMRHAHTPA